MRFLLVSVLLVFWVSVPGATAFAQVQIDLKEVAKIHLVDGAGYLGGFYRNDYDLVPENGQWKTYQTREKHSRNYHKKVGSKPVEALDSAEHRFIKVIPNDSIRLFLHSLSIIKPKFHPADLKLSIPELRIQLDTGMLKNLDEESLRVFNSFFDTPAKLYHLLNTMQHDSWTDDWPYSVMEIIKKKGDTIKVVTTSQLDFMLPWRVNNIPTYNLELNRFFINATNVKDHRMSGKSLIWHLYRWIDYFYATDAFERLRLRETAPANFKFLQQHFDIIQIAMYNDSSTFVSHPKKQSNHLRVSGPLNIANKEHLLSLTRYAEDTLKRFLKKRAFMIDSCLAKKGCTINFGSHTSHQHFTQSYTAANEYLNRFSKQTLSAFTIKYGERTEDNWIALPNGNFVLTAYLGNYAVGIKPEYILKDKFQMRRFVFMLFSPQGKLLQSAK